MAGPGPQRVMPSNPGTQLPFFWTTIQRGLQGPSVLFKMPLTLSQNREKPTEYWRRCSWKGRLDNTHSNPCLSQNAAVQGRHLCGQGSSTKPWVQDFTGVLRKCFPMPRALTAAQIPLTNPSSSSLHPVQGSSPSSWVFPRVALGIQYNPLS